MAEIKTPTIKMPKLALPKFPAMKLPPLPFSVAPKKSKTLVIEAGDEWLKLLGFEEDGNKKKVLCLAAESIQGKSEIDIGKKIMDFLKAQNFKPKEVLLSHPSHNLTARLLVLPSTDPKEIRDIIELQAVKQTPYAKEEITSGFRILDHDQTGYSRVLLAISHRDVASRYFRLAEFGAINGDKLSVALEGIQSWYRAVRAKEAVQSSQVVLLLDMDWLSTDLLILSGEKLLFNRCILIGAKQFQEQGAVIEPEFLKEVQRSIESGSAEMKSEKITHIVLSGNQNAAKNVAASLTRELNLPCETIPVFRDLEDRIPAAVSESVKDTPVSFVSIAGLALNPQGSMINLIPPEIAIRKGLQERAKDLGFLGTLLIALVMLVTVISFEKIYKKTSYLNRLQNEFKLVRKDAEDTERLVNKMRLAQDQMIAGESFLDVLHDVNEVIPKEIFLTSVQYNHKDKLVVFRGISNEMSGVFQFLTTLEATPQLQFVKTRTVTKKKIEDKDVAEFEIVAAVGQDAKPPDMSAITPTPEVKSEAPEKGIKSGKGAKAKDDKAVLLENKAKPKEAKK